MALPLAATSWARRRGTIGHKGPDQAPRDRVGRRRGGRKKSDGGFQRPLLSLAPPPAPAEIEVVFTMVTGWGRRPLLSSMAVSPRFRQVVKASRWLTADHSVVTSGLHDEAVTDASAL